MTSKLVRPLEVSGAHRKNGDSDKGRGEANVARDLVAPTQLRLPSVQYHTGQTAVGAPIAREDEAGAHNTRQLRIQRGPHQYLAQTTVSSVERRQPMNLSCW